MTIRHISKVTLSTTILKDENNLQEKKLDHGKKKRGWNITSSYLFGGKIQGNQVMWRC